MAISSTARSSTPPSRQPDPERLLAAYHQSVATLNLLRAFTTGGFAALSRVHAWNQEFVANSLEGKRYEVVADEIERALQFMKACGIDLHDDGALQGVDFYTSHEALILPYEQALTRRTHSPATGTTAPRTCLWIGDRTRQLDGAHVEFLRGCPTRSASRSVRRWAPMNCLRLVDVLNPENRAGRLTLIARMGDQLVSDRLPPLVERLRTEGRDVVWACDPMHGNTFVAAGGQKTRRFDDVLSETSKFFDVHTQLGTWPGGLHIELTGDNVTECLGGGSRLNEGDLNVNYTSICDPAAQRHPEPRHGLSRRGVPPALLRGQRRAVVVTQQPDPAVAELDLGHRTVLDARSKSHLGSDALVDLHRLFDEPAVHNEDDQFVRM